jgi:hypothetical protein
MLHHTQPWNFSGADLTKSAILADRVRQCCVLDHYVAPLGMPLTCCCCRPPVIPRCSKTFLSIMGVLDRLRYVAAMMA